MINDNVQQKSDIFELSNYSFLHNFNNGIVYFGNKNYLFTLLKFYI